MDYTNWQYAEPGSVEDRNFYISAMREEGYYPCLDNWVLVDQYEVNPLIINYDWLRFHAKRPADLFVNFLTCGVKEALVSALSSSGYGYGEKELYLIGNVHGHKEIDDGESIITSRIVRVGKVTLSDDKLLENYERFEKHGLHVFCFETKNGSRYYVDFGTVRTGFSDLFIRMPRRATNQTVETDRS